MPGATKGDQSQLAQRQRAKVSPKPFHLQDLHDTPAPRTHTSTNVVGEVEMDLRIELGRTTMRLEEILKLRRGSLVALDDMVNDPVNIYVNERLIARGELLAMDDRFCVRILELIGV